jgi:hypothetical protein
MRSPNPLRISRAVRHRAHVLSLAAVLATLGACADQPTGPSQPTGRSAASMPQDVTPPDAVAPQAMQPEAAKFWERLASVRWNEVAEDLTESRAVNALRVYAYLSLAQFRAAEAASAVRPHPPISAAIAGASAAVLAHFFPGDLAVIDGALATQAATPEWPGAKHADFAAGVAIGRDIGARVIAWSAGDGVGLTDPGTPPVAGAPPAQSSAHNRPQGLSDNGICRGRGNVSFDEVTNSVSITAAVSALDDLVAFAESLDLRQPQVNIKAKIVLVNRTDLDALGIKYDLGTRQQFFSQVIQRVDSTGNLGTPNDPPRVLLGGNTVSAIANASGNVPGAALRLIYSTALGGFDFSTFLDALQEVSLLDVQAEPSVTTVNNKTAELVSGVQVPFVPLISSGGGQTQLNAPVAVERIQTGVTLRVTPSVTNNGHIMMRVETVNSDVNFTNNGTLIDNNSNRTELLVADGETVVIAGLTQTSVRVSKSGIPLLVDLPLIGRLFGYTTRQEQRRDLLIMLTPHIIDEGEQPSDAGRR